MKKKKIIVIVSIALVSLLGGTTYQYTSYGQYKNKVNNAIDHNEYDYLKTLVNDNLKLNVFKKIYFNNELTNKLNNKLDSILQEAKEEDGDLDNYLESVESIKEYDVVQDKAESISDNIEFLIKYNEAVNLFKSEKYIEAYKAFTLLADIPSECSEYKDKINKYKSDSKESIKGSIFIKVDFLLEKNQYTEAKELLNGVSDILGDNDEFVKKLTEVYKLEEKYNSDEKKKEELKKAEEEEKKKEEEALENKINEAESDKNALTSLNTNNINSLNIVSDTNNIVYVDLSTQTMNIYNGEVNKWNLVSSFSISSGVNGSETPKGVTKVSNSKGPWYFDEDYNEGAKYWVRMANGVLFESILFAEDKSTVVNGTLGTPASDGTVRLSEENAKWFYSNIKSGTKVIIK